MSLLLTLVQAPHAQAVRQIRLDDGTIVIGRSAESDWRIDDPDQYVSRAHCTVSGGDGHFTVTDTSSGGLFVDDAPAPLGPGRPMALRDGMRLRLGDYVVQVELRRSAPAAAPPARSEAGADDFFTPRVEAPRPVRPSALPDPFESPSRFLPHVEVAPPEARGRPTLDDPFSLGPPSPSRHRERPAPSEAEIGTHGYEEDIPNSQPAHAGTPWFDVGPTPAPASPPAAKRAWDENLWTGEGGGGGEAAAPRPATAAPGDGGALFVAFMRGLGLDAADAPDGDPLARMEAFGREYRMMAEGMMQLLRNRAQEKGNARIAQTVVGSSEVNPLKFMPTVEDALAVMVGPRSGGFAEAEVAIGSAFRDLATHNASTWRATQAALRRLVDRFDPSVLETELEALGLLETLLAGGRRAKLWELYQKRFRDIAASAETRFLGEVGVDFREAYEREG